MRIPWKSTTLVLLVAVWCGTVEAADRGDSLYLAAVWLLAAACSLVVSRNGIVDSGRAGKFAGGGLLLLTAGHLFSTLVVFQNGGDRRAAVTLSLEWIGLCAAWVSLRQYVSSGRGRMLLTETLIAVTAGLACSGCWQFFVQQPAAVEWYTSLRSELDELNESGGFAQNLRAQEIREEFQRQGVPLEGTGRAMWENRLLYSSEPTGPFALANTLAGFLAVGLVLGIGCLRFTGTGTTWRLLPGLLLVLSCLVLTKSRSAWLGTVSGLILLFVIRHRGQAGQQFRGLLPVGLVISLLVIVLAVSGGVLDPEVVLETPRSLQFRLMYWAGTLEMLRASPLAGVGPGNFREHYLPYRWPQSSEEIRDPHNLLLDAWSAAGIVGVIGLLLLLYGFVCGGFERANRQGLEKTEWTSRRPGFHVLMVSCVGLLIQLSSQWLQGGEFAGDYGRLLVAAGGLLAVIRGGGRISADRATALAAGSALVIHLLAAGGFEVPAVVLLLLCSVVLAVVPDRVDQQAVRTHLLWWQRSLAVGFLATAVFTMTSGLVPLIQSGLAISRALVRIPTERSASEAEASEIREYLETAAAADPWSLAAVRRQCLFELQQLKGVCDQLAQTDVNSERISHFSRAVTEQLDRGLSAGTRLIQRHPQSAEGYRLRGSCLSTAAAALDSPGLLRDAISDFEMVVRRNPVDVSGWVQLALVQAGAGDGDSATVSANRALELNRINTDWGHRDRVLNESELNDLREIVVFE